MTKTVFASSLVFSLLTAPVAFGATSGASSAFGESVKVKLLPILGSPVQVSSGPLPMVSGAAAPPYANTSQVASATVALGLLAGLNTGLLTVNAASNLPNTSGASADATVNGTKAFADGLLGLSATVIQSSANAGGSCGAFTATGATVLVGATLNGISLAANPSPNTVVLNVGDVKVILNEQIVSGNGTTGSSIVVNAIHVILTDAPLGLGLISGDIIISQSTASQRCTPSTADLSILKTANPTQVHIGDALVYHIAVNDNGPDTATGVIVTDTLPQGVVFDSATTSQGTCSGTTVIACALGTVPPGDTVLIDIHVTVTSGHLSNTASVKGNEGDPSPGNNSSTVNVTVVH